MLLRESGAQTDTSYDLNSVTADTGDSGVPHSQWLRRLTEAAISSNWLALAEMRDEAEAAMGKQQVVDALTVAAAFNGITRVADCTGIPLDPDTEHSTGAMRSETGIDQFAYDHKSQRYADS